MASLSIIHDTVKISNPSGHNKTKKTNVIFFFAVKETGSDTESELRFWLDMMYRAGKTLNSICNQSDNHFKCLER